MAVKTGSDRFFQTANPTGITHAEHNYYFTLFLSCGQHVEKFHGKLVSCVEFTSYEYSRLIDTGGGNFHFQEVESDFPTSKLPEMLGSNTFEGSTSVQLPLHEAPSYTAHMSNAVPVQ
jgi:hypothetical protein